MKRFLFAATILVVVTPLGGGCVPTPKSPSQAVVAATGVYEAAGKLALEYLALPACGPSAPTVCKSDRASMQIARASAVARASLDQALDVIADPSKTSTTKQTAITAAESAVTVFKAVAEQYKVTK